jgi:hypothetical protein
MPHYPPKRYRRELEEAIWAVRLEIRSQSLAVGVFSESERAYILDELRMELVQLENALAKIPDNEGRTAGATG